MPDQTVADQRIESLLEGLNAPQRDAVTHGDGPLLILAGAGSGKTRVLTHRIAYLVHSGEARADELLAITFTNKAAQEMRERVELLLGRSTRGMWVMTFHAACTRMLRVEAPRLGYTRQFTIYDQADARRLLKACLDRVGADPKRFPTAAVHSQISDAKNRLRDAAEYRSMVGSYFEQTVADAYELYEHELLRFNAMDFDDLLVRAVNVLELFAEVRERYQEAFRHVLVDEYQDTNHAQYRWLTLLSGERRNLAVVGDDAQSIYGFRGADIRNILDFGDDFPDARIVKLEQNYRSTQTILSAANAVIANNRGQVAKDLWTDLGEGDPIKVRMLGRRARRGALRAERDRGLRRRRRVTLRGGGLLPHQRAVAGARGRARAGRDPLPGDRRHQVLRARGDQGRDRLPLAARQPGRPGELHARRQQPPARDRPDVALAGDRPRRHAREPVWDVARDPERVPGLGRAAISAIGRFMETMEELRGARPRRRAGLRAARGGALAQRLRRGARGRADHRGAGADREPRGARRRWRASSTHRPAGPSGEGEPGCLEQSRWRWSATPTPAATIAGS